MVDSLLAQWEFHSQNCTVMFVETDGATLAPWELDPPQDAPEHQGFEGQQKP